MKVYLVQYLNEADNPIVGAFSTEEKAMSCIRAKLDTGHTLVRHSSRILHIQDRQGQTYISTYSIIEMELDA